MKFQSSNARVPQRHSSPLAAESGGAPTDSSLSSQVVRESSRSTNTSSAASSTRDRHEIVHQLKHQLKHFRARSPSRSLAAQLADDLVLEDASAVRPTSRLEARDSEWIDQSQVVPDWDDLHARPLDDVEHDASSENTLASPASHGPVSPGPVFPGEPESTTHPAPEPSSEHSLTSSPLPDTVVPRQVPLDASDNSSIASTDTLPEWDGVTEIASLTPPRIFPTPCPALNQWFPDRGIPAGSIVEVVCSDIGAGATHFCLTLAQSICGHDGLLVVIDRRHDFHAEALVGLGWDLENVLLVRPENDEDHGWALEQALAHPSVGAVWTRIETCDSRRQRRWQLAAEKSQAVGILQRPDRVIGAPHWAFAQLQLKPSPHSHQLTGNTSYYQTHPRRASSGSSSRANEAEGLHDENWVMEIRGVRIRGHFEQPTLRLELHNQEPGTSVSSGRPNASLSWRTVHPNDLPVTKNPERSPATSSRHSPQENTPQEGHDDVPTSVPGTPGGTSFRHGSPPIRRPTEDRLRLASQLADSKTNRRASSA